MEPFFTLTDSAPDFPPIHAPTVRIVDFAPASPSAVVSIDNKAAPHTLILTQDAVNAMRRSDKRAERQRCKADVCEACRRGDVAEHSESEGIGVSWWHQYCQCRAAAIYERERRDKL